MTHVLQWINTESGEAWEDIALFFASTNLPPIMVASVDSGAIAAAKTLVPGGFMQSDSEHNTVVTELSRLSQAGMNMLASRSQLAALGYWDLGQGSSDSLNCAIVWSFK
jgi:hypothetical protein